MKKLKCPFVDNIQIGTVTAANASPMSDGAAVVIIASGSAVKLHGLEPLARIVGWADASTDPLHFTIAPYHSIMNALRMINYKLEDVDYFEINEAFASVAIANSKLLGIDVEKINVCGGAIAIGHPLGA